jgi:hypothetical protein
MNGSERKRKRNLLIHRQPALNTIFAPESIALIGAAEAPGSRRDFREIPPKVEYSLTERGVELANVLRPLCEWGKENFSEQIAPPPLESYATPRNLAA